jgi:hypothetical protein
LSFLFLLAVTIAPAMANWQMDEVGQISDSAEDIPVTIAYDSEDVPHIVYYNPDKDLIRHAWRSGASWITEDVGASAGTRSLSLAFDPTGNPCISYGDGVHFGNLMFAQRNASGWSSSTVSRGTWGFLGNAGSYSSVAFDHQGVPHIAYSDGSASATLYYASLDKMKRSWNSVKVYGGESPMTAMGLEPSLTFNNNDWPVISYMGVMREAKEIMTNHGFFPVTDYYWHFMYSHTKDGVTWLTESPDYSASKGKVNAGIDLAMDIHGNPHYSYYGSDRQSNYVGYLMRYGDLWIKETVYSWSYGSLIENFATSIAVDSHDIPHLSFISESGKLTYATKPASGQAWSLDTVDNSIRVYHHAIALNRNNRPAIAYVNANATVMVAQWTE